MAMTIAPFFKRGSSFGLRAAHFEDDIGAVHGVGGDRCSGRGIVGVENAGFLPGAGFDRNVGAECDDLFDGLGRGGNARLTPISFGSNRNLHKSSDCGTARYQADVGIVRLD